MFTSKNIFTLDCIIESIFHYIETTILKDCYEIYGTKSLDNMTFINLVVVKRNYLALLNLPFELKLLINYCYLNLLN